MNTKIVKSNQKPLSLDRKVWQALCENNNFTQLTVMLKNNYRLNEEDLSYLFNQLSLDGSQLHNLELFILSQEISEFLLNEKKDGSLEFGEEYWTHKFKNEDVNNFKEFIEIDLLACNYEQLEVLEKIDFVKNYKTKLIKFLSHIQGSPYYYKKYEDMIASETALIINVIAAEKVSVEKTKIINSIGKFKSAKAVKKAVKTKI